MSKYTYAGPFKNPVTGWYVKEVNEKYEIWISHEREADGSCEPDRKHTSAPAFDDSEEAEQYIENMRESIEDDYDQYLDENHDEIRRMEEYENFRNEY